MSKPNYYFNGYPAYKNFYLISSKINFTRFKDIVEGIIWERAHSNKPKWIAELQTYIADNFRNYPVLYTEDCTGNNIERVKKIGKFDVYYCGSYDCIEIVGLNKAEKELLAEYNLNEYDYGQWSSYIRNGQIGEIK